ncbi:hypothetical protein, partial [uncultured Alistipes sp.]|uniref:hypothetical protein n=1 Tax=uncultured Alistipes sp. TaxID=538949 RepID=UPI00264974E5
LLSLVFETNASTDSAIRANRLQRRIGRTKIGINSQFAIPNTQLFQSKPKKHGFSLGLCRGEKFCIKINFFIQSRFFAALRMTMAAISWNNRRGGETTERFSSAAAGGGASMMRAAADGNAKRCRVCRIAKKG